MTNCDWWEYRSWTVEEEKGSEGSQVNSPKHRSCWKSTEENSSIALTHRESQSSVCNHHDNDSTTASRAVFHFLYGIHILRLGAMDLIGKHVKVQTNRAWRGPGVCVSITRTGQYQTAVVRNGYSAVTALQPKSLTVFCNGNQLRSLRGLKVETAKQEKLPICKLKSGCGIDSPVLSGSRLGRFFRSLNREEEEEENEEDSWWRRLRRRRSLRGGGCVGPGCGGRGGGGGGWGSFRYSVRVCFFDSSLCVVTRACNSI